MTEPMSDTRLIEQWLPITEIGIESLRERGALSALPPIYYLHVWWARRPLVASRAAILASLLPADADHEKFRHILGIHGDPVKGKRDIEQARRTGIHVENPYGYSRAFAYVPDDTDRKWLASFGERLKGSVLDPTAGGGSIPLEAARLGLPTFANDLNPVASLIEHATVKWPTELGMAVKSEFERLASEWRKRVAMQLADFFPQHRAPNEIDCTYIWARTIRCPYCDGLVPLSPNWRLATDGTGLQLIPHNDINPAKRRCDFKIVRKVTDQSPGTTAGGDARCPFLGCGRVIDKAEVKQQAQAGKMGDQLYAVVIKRRIVTKTKTGKDKIKWERDYRSALPNDNDFSAVAARLAEKLPEWEALDIVPNEALPMDTESWTHGNTPAQYGAKRFIDLFSMRQLLAHGTSVEVFSKLVQELSSPTLSDLQKAGLGYLALAIDRLIDWNSRQCTWELSKLRMAHTFHAHAFPHKSSFAEMDLLVEGLGFDWTIKQTANCIKELVEMCRPQEARNDNTPELPFFSQVWIPPLITLSCKSGDSLDHLSTGSVDAVVMDPPYYDNVMYAELSDFFYVWLKRTAGQIFPELFRRHLTDKENEAIANVAKFHRQKGAKALAGRDYQERMAAIFTECRRVLKPDGIMTLMFTHKATGAWDALTKGLMHAGFTITASWPINTEAEGSLHIKDKAAANSTIFLACRPRAVLPSDTDMQYWEDVEPIVAGAVRKRVAEFQAAGIRGVDLYLASFGPALEEFSKHWPLKRGTPNPLPPSLKRAQKELFPEEWDPYAVSPEDALNAARREVKSWRLEQLTHKRARTEFDPRTSWFVLAWDAFQAPAFPYDEALRLARAVGVDLEKDIVGSLANKKGSDLVMWDSVQRGNKGALGSADGSSGMIDALHHAAYLGRTKTLESARELLERAGIMDNPNFRSAMQAILEVLPVGTAFSGVELPTDVAGAGNDFEAIEKLRRLAFADQVEEPQQLSLWQPTTI